MNRKKIKQLLKENNQLDQQMSKESQAIYTDMVLYLRGSSLSDYQQELVRNDLINMILDGEQRGCSIQEILGEDYHTMCDEIIASFPPKTRKDKVLSTAALLCLCASIMLIIYCVKSVILETIVHHDPLLFQLQSSHIIYLVSGIVIAVLVFKSITINSLSHTGQKDQKRSERFYWFKIWLVLFIICSALYLFNTYINYNLMSFSIFYVLGTAALLRLFYYIFNQMTDY